MNAGVGDYQIPAFAGMMTVCEVKASSRRDSYSDAATFAPPFDTATSAGRSTRSPIV